MRYLTGYSSMASPVARGESRLSAFARYYQYLKERFPLGQFLPLSAVISLSAAFGTQAYFYGRPNSVSAAVMTFTAVLLLFLRLRLVDELKDLQHDREFYPERPVPRGLVRPPDVARAAVVVFLLEVIVATIGGIQSLGLFALVGLYSFLTLQEFFTRKWLRSHFTVYVVSHGVLILPFCFYLYSLSGLGLADIRKPYFWYLTAFISSIVLLLEVTRKLRSKELEVASQDTYTARYGVGYSCFLAGFLAASVAVTGILTATALGSDISGLGYVGLFFLIPVAYSLLAFAKRPIKRNANAVLSWCAVLAVATSALFTLTVWLVP